MIILVKEVEETMKIYNSKSQPRKVMHMGGELQTDMSAPLKKSPFAMSAAEKQMKPTGMPKMMRYGGKARKR